MNRNKKQNRHSATLKKNVVDLTGILIVISLAACSNKPEASEGAAQNVKTEQEATGVGQETEGMAICLSSRVK